MESIDELLGTIQQYFKNLQQVNKCWYILIEVPDNWIVYPSEDKRILVTEYKLKANEQQKSGVKKYWYCSTNEEVKISEIVSLIKEMVRLNIEAIKKMNLLKDKFEELKAIFRNLEYSYETLLQLKFTINGKEITETSEVEDESNKEENIQDILETVGEPIATIEQKVEKTTKKTNKHSKTIAKSEKETKNVAKTEVTKEVNATELSKSEIDELRG